MGKIYKRKRRSCKMCKPHKMGWVPKEKSKAKQEREIVEKEIKERTILHGRNGGRMVFDFPIETMHFNNFFREMRDYDL